MIIGLFGLIFIIMSCIGGASVLIALFMVPTMIFGSAVREVTEKPRKAYKETREAQKMKDPLYEKASRINTVASKNYFKNKIERKIYFNNGECIIKLDIMDDMLERQAYTKAMKELGIKNYRFQK